MATLLFNSKPSPRRSADPCPASGCLPRFPASFGGLALLLATIGLYGVTSYNIARRRGEIGIRMALGATESRVLHIVLGEVAILVAVGLVIGFALSLGATRLIASFLYGVKADDPVTLSLAAAVLSLVATIAGFLPARRASRLDPMASLREE